VRPFAFLVALALCLACAHVTTAGRVTNLPSTPQQMTVLLPAVARLARARGLPTSVAAYRVAITLPDGATVAWYVVGTEALMAIDEPPMEQSKVEPAVAATYQQAKALWNEAVLQLADAGS